MVRDGENGYIYEVGDFFSLAACIGRIAEDRELYGKMSERAFHLFKTEFNSKKMTANTEKLYYELYKKRQGEEKMARGSEL